MLFYHKDVVPFFNLASIISAMFSFSTFMFYMNIYDKENSDRITSLPYQ